MATKKSTDNNKSLTMADLMAGMSSKKLSFNRGDEVEGEIILLSGNEVVVDLGAKAEGVIDKREFSTDQLKAIKVGGKVSAFVLSENTSGQTLLTLQNRASRRITEVPKRWQQFVNAQNKNTRLNGRVTEINRGGLVVEVDGIRGFLPTSQVSFDLILAAGEKGGLDHLVGQDIAVKVIEVDPSNNRLIFSNRSSAGEDIKKKLTVYQPGKKVKGKIIVTTPLGVFLRLEDGLEGLVFTYELSWDKGEGTEVAFEVGQEVEAVVTGVDENMGRVNLSLRQITEDPFEKLSENYLVDDVVKGTVMDISQAGVTVSLEDGVEGFIAATAIEPGTNYEIGQATSFLVDSIDKNHRKINLAPFITSTKGLIYK